MIRLLKAPNGDFRDWNAIAARLRTLVSLFDGEIGIH